MIHVHYAKPLGGHRERQDTSRSRHRRQGRQQQMSEKLSPAERKIARDLVKRLNRVIVHARAKR